jgi:hypothetical protein
MRPRVSSSIALHPLAAERTPTDTGVDARPHAARVRPVPGRIAQPDALAVRRGRAVPTPPLGMSWRPGAAAIGLAIVMALSGALAVGIGIGIGIGIGEPAAVGTNSIVPSHLGPGYPPHHGLAGPSRVAPSPASWLGYPPHYGLAGPSQVGPSAAPIGIGAGYPPHYGLAGPSQIDDGN